MTGAYRAALGEDFEMNIAKSFTIVGVILVVIGIFALINPFAASFAVTVLVGAAFLLAGVVQAWVVFNDKTAQDRLWHALVALMNIVVGVWLLADWGAGMASLTLLLGVLFLAGGVVRILVAIQRSAGRIRLALIASGAISALLGVLIFSNFAAMADSFLGVLLGIEMLMNGGGLIVLGYVLRNGPPSAR
ncbi:hypothetical protein ERN12_15090 [Rhodobacteraceae bacterium]|nr:hypothetical protein ERN12_15090 [Paracoccaceae bacterium]